MSDEERKDRLEEGAVEEGDVAAEAMLYCPVCNERLTARKCKLLCEKCGYFMSCADYY